MKQLVYISRGTVPFSAEDIRKLTEISNNNNMSRGITGCMVYASGYFLQLLEGDQDEVDSLYKKIQQDTRHKNSRILIENEVDESKRLYGKWFMSSFNIDAVTDFPEELKQSINNIINGKTGIPVHRIFMEFRKYLAS